MAMGGIGEAMLLGAAMGGGSAALTGGDPLKGALLGGLTGGVGGAISPALSAMTGGTSAALTPAITEAGVAAASAAPVATNVATNAATNLATSTAPSGGISSLLGENAAQNIASAPNLYPPGFGSPNTATLLTPYGTSYAIPAAGSNVVPSTAPQTFGQGMAKFAEDPVASMMRNKGTAFGAALQGATGARKKMEEEEEYDGPLSRFKFNPESYRSSFFAAEGGIADLTGGYDRIVGEEPMYMSNMASGGISNLGSYSDGGRMLRGPGDGMSDSIPASISGKRPARLADGEFVVPADVVSHLGNGSTDAGAKQLYAMMDKVRKARTGRKAQGREINPRQYMAA